MSAVPSTRPTIHGALRLAFRRREGGIDCELEVPAGVTVELVPPSGRPVRFGAGSHRHATGV